MTSAVTTCVRAATCGVLLTAGGLHLAWGRGSSFPFATSAGLADKVVGTPRTPSPGACYTVASGLATAAALVAIPSRNRPHRLVLGALATVFAVRAAFGFAGRTDLIVPGSSSPAFRRNDRRVFSPICLGLALGVATAGRADP